MDVGDTQTQLSQWAAQDRTHRFYDLYHLLYHEDWLRTAQAHVKQNAGSRTAGCDGMDMRAFEERLEDNLTRLGEDLKTGRCAPQPVRRTYIREVTAGGRLTMRPLGIPAIRDRIVQEALRMILEPIWEADLNHHSDGVRPNRSTKDAVAYIGARLTGGRGQAYGWIVEGDIQSFFDTIDHHKLMHLLRRRMKDNKTLALIWKFLRAGILEQGNVRHSIRGTPQGGIVSPLLANIYLHELDRYMERYTEIPGHRRARRKPRKMANFLSVRYADDFVVLGDGTKAQAEGMRQELYQFLKGELQLELSLEKTKVTHIHEGFECLGYRIERGITGTGKWAPRIRIPARALEKARHKIRAALRPSTHRDSMRGKILALNRIIGGWCRDYHTTSSPSLYFRKLDAEVFWLMAHGLGRQYHMSIPKGLKKFRRQRTFGTGSVVLRMPSDYKAERQSLRVITNPYTSSATTMPRENLDALEAAWVGTEARKGMMDRKDVVYQRDQGICGQCGEPVPWEEAALDHKMPRHRFKPLQSGDILANLWILHHEPCHRIKTNRDLRCESRVR